MKKINWVVSMYRDWRSVRNFESDYINCDLDNAESITQDELSFALCRFIPEIKKYNGGDFPGKTLYEIVMCVQFHLETLGFNYKFLSDDSFTDVKYCLDNVMKDRTSQGIGIHSSQVDILTYTDEDV